MKVYIAGPFFSEYQKEVIEQIEFILKDHCIEYFSPMQFGIINEILPTATKEERDKIIKSIYDKNIEELFACNTMLCVIDNFDTGTIFELGFMKALSSTSPKIIITFSPKGYGLNVMLSHSSNNHIQKFEDIIPALKGILVKEKAETIQ